jgi:excisionase family DNA binding protein
MADRNADTSALFVRIPHAQARALDRIAFESGRPKQVVVSELISRYFNEPAARLQAPLRPARSDGEPVLGRHSFRAFESDVLTLEGVAELLAVESELVAELAASGELPGRLIGERWRFARSAVLAWLASPAGGAPAPDAPGQ